MKKSKSKKGGQFKRVKIKLKLLKTAVALRKFVEAFEELAKEASGK